MTPRKKSEAAFLEAGFCVERTAASLGTAASRVWIRRNGDRAVVICLDRSPPDPTDIPISLRQRCVLHTFDLGPGGSWGDDPPLTAVCGTAEQLLLSVRLADWHEANVQRT